jgi:hypothetical protein
MESRTIVIPSRARVRNMKRVLSLLPSAIVCVAKREEQDYAAAVGNARLITHDNLPGIIAIRNWLNETIQEDCLVMVDDDLKCIYPQIGKQIKVTDPELIAHVIDNAHRVSEDLDIGVFCWTRTRNAFMVEPEYLPFRFVAPVMCSFGLRGAARGRRFDPELPGRADFDFAFQTALEDRICLQDMRWYFDHGRIFAGRGGNAGVISKEQFDASTKRLTAKWGQFVSTKRAAYIKSKAGSAVGMKVQRSNPIVKFERDD